MAKLQGKGAFTGVNLLAKVYDNGVTKDGKTRFIDAQIDNRDPRGPEQTNLHLVSSEIKDKDGKVRYNNGAAYSAGQFEEIVKAAGPNSEPITNKDGREIGRVYAIKANVMPSTRGNGLVINTKSLSQSDHRVDAKTLDNQFTSMKAAKEAHAATTATQAEAPAAEAQVQAAGLTADVPVYEPGEEQLAVG